MALSYKGINGVPLDNNGKIEQAYLADGTEVNTVNSRDLWKGLTDEAGDFSSWIKRQLERAKLMEGRDFILVIEKDEQRGRSGLY
jgi:phage anti-repressor protein